LSRKQRHGARSDSYKVHDYGLVLEKECCSFEKGLVSDNTSAEKKNSP